MFRLFVVADALLGWGYGRGAYMITATPASAGRPSAEDTEPKKTLTFDLSSTFTLQA